MRSRSSATRYAWVAILYFIQGFPYGIVNKTMPIVFSAHGVDLGAIGLLSLVGLPWTFKFLWAPLVDRIGARRQWTAACLASMAALIAAFGYHFDGRVDSMVWMILAGLAFFSATQDIAIDAGTIEMLHEHELGTANGIRVTAYRVALILAGGLLISIAVGMELPNEIYGLKLPDLIGGASWSGLGWATTWTMTAVCALLMAPIVLSMPHDERAPEEKGSIRQVVWRVGSKMLLPLAVSTGTWYATLWYSGVSERFRAPFAVLFGVAACLVAAFSATAGRILLPIAVSAATWFAAPFWGVHHVYHAPLVVIFGVAACIVAAFSASKDEAGSNEPLKLLLGKRGSWAIILFILAFKIGDGAMAPMTTPFLNRGAGMSPSDIGLLLNTFGIGGAIFGAMIGGLFTSRWGVFRSLWILGIFQAVSNLGYVYAATHTAPEFVWSAALFEAFCGGLGTAPFLAFLMSLCDRRHAATQYAFLSAIYGLSNAIAGGFSGYAAESLGFGPYFLVTFFLALPAFALLPIVRSWIPEHSDDTVGA